MSVKCIQRVVAAEAATPIFDVLSSESAGSENSTSQKPYGGRSV